MTDNTRPGKSTSPLLQQLFDARAEQLKALLDLAQVRAQRDALQARLDAIRDLCHPVDSGEVRMVVIDEAQAPDQIGWVACTNVVAGEAGRGKTPAGQVEALMRMARKAGVHYGPDPRDMIQRARVEDLGRPATTDLGGGVPFVAGVVPHPTGEPAGKLQRKLARRRGTRIIRRLAFNAICAANTPVTVDDLVETIGAKFPPSRPLTRVEMVTALAQLVDSGDVQMFAVAGRPAYQDTERATVANSLGFLDVVVAEHIAAASVDGITATMILHTIRDQYPFPGYLRLNDRTVRSACFTLVSVGIARQPFTHGRLFYLAALAPARWWR